MTNDIIEKIADEIYKCDKNLIEKIVNESKKEGISDKQIAEGISRGLVKISNGLLKGEIFLSQAGVATKTVDTIMDSLDKSQMPKNNKTVVLGTVEGDVHDIGKTILATSFKAAGFNVYDLGVDVLNEKFIEAVEKYDADLLSLSALMTVTMINQKDIIEMLKEKNLRDGLVVMVGGSPVTKEWAEEIGADLYATDAFEGLKIAKEALGIKD